MWLFNTLFNRSKANRRIFDFPSLKNRFPTKKALCFSLLRIGLSVSFFCFVFTCFFYSFFPYLLAVLFGFRVHDYYKTVFSFSKTFSKKIFWNVLKNHFSRYGTHARENCFQTIENQCFIKSKNFWIQRFSKRAFYANLGGTAEFLCFVPFRGRSFFI